MELIKELTQKEKKKRLKKARKSIVSTQNIINGLDVYIAELNKEILEVSNENGEIVLLEMKNIVLEKKKRALARLARLEEVLIQLRA